MKKYFPKNKNHNLILFIEKVNVIKIYYQMLSQDHILSGEITRFSKKESNKKSKGQIRRNRIS